MLKILQKQYQLIILSTSSNTENNVSPDYYAIKYKNVEHIYDFLVSKGDTENNNSDYIKSVDKKPRGYKEISFKKFREIHI